MAIQLAYKSALLPMFGCQEGGRQFGTVVPLLYQAVAKLIAETDRLLQTGVTHPKHNFINRREDHKDLYIFASEQVVNVILCDEN